MKKEFNKIKNKGFTQYDNLDLPGRRTRFSTGLSRRQLGYSSGLRKIKFSFRKPRRSCSTGFTLPELLTGLAIFSLVIGAASGVFISAIRGQRKSMAYQELLDQTSYLTEYMSRALRMATKDLSLSGDCISQKTNYENPDGDSSRIRFLDYAGRCHEFLKEGDVLKERRSIDGSALSLGEAIPLTGTGLKVEAAIFYLSGQSQTDNLQPKVTFFLKVKSVGEKPEQQAEIKLQTSISQRNLDIEQ